jgi:hypothetical protein
VRTDLFTLAHALDPHVVDAVVPPACRRSTIRATPARPTRSDTVIETDPWRPRQPARHFVPSLALLARELTGVRFELSVERRGRWSPWVASAVLGHDGFDSLPTTTEALTCDIDVFTTREPVDAVRLRVRLRTDDAALDAPWLVTLSASDLAPLERMHGTAGRVRVPVPPRSQMVEADAIRVRICSPTSVAMVLEHWGRRVETAALAAEIFHPGLERYGVWPAAVRAAGRHGLAGYLLRFPDWVSAAWCLDAGLPIVASVHYGRGELPGAAMDETDGHLVVLTGYDNGHVLINDPAAPSSLEVPRRVRLADLERVWLERAGVGYVFFDPSRAS